MLTGTHNPFVAAAIRKDKMNLVVPEWIFIDPTADTVTTDIDPRAWAVMKKSGVKILPILSNNFKEVFRGDACTGSSMTRRKNNG